MIPSNRAFIADLLFFSFRSCGNPTSRLLRVLSNLHANKASAIVGDARGTLLETGSGIKLPSVAKVIHPAAVLNLGQGSSRLPHARDRSLACAFKYR
jgi:hypothetical protein